MDTSLSRINKRVLKEPLGFIRILELPMAILAFATTSGYSHVIKIPFMCTTQSYKSIDFGYPFDLTSIKVPGNFCIPLDVATVCPFSYGASSQSQFFVCTGVLSFLYVLAILSVYLLSWDAYKKDPRYAMADTVITGILALFWFIGSCAWASGLSMVKSVTDPEMIGVQLRSRKGVYPCSTVDGASRMCTPELTWNYAALNITLILGFACVGLWVANIWFIYKETVWYKNRMATMGAGPPSGIPTGSSFGVPPGQSAMPAAGGVNIRPPGSEFQY